MNPDQLEGQEADARADLFAFGAVLPLLPRGVILAVVAPWLG